MSSPLIQKRPSSSKRHIADFETLSQYNAAPIYDVESNDNDSVISNAPSFYHEDEDMRRNHDRRMLESSIVSTTTADAVSYVTGISISDWYIQTSSSTIANEREMDALTAKLQNVANSWNEEDDGSHSIGCDDDDVRRSKEVQPFLRRLNIPEIVFLNAFVQLKLKRNQRGVEEEDFKLIHLTWNASDALGEWASCHLHLSENDIDEGGNIISSYRGVSIVKSIDAKLWSERQIKHQQQQQQHLRSSQTSETYFDHSAIRPSNNQFNYDWTFSTPYVGTSTIIQNLDSNKNYQKQNMEWIPSKSSLLDLSYLTDQTQPILYFDEINLFEDDMHDNGYVSLRCKIRVMPTCLFLLQSLFVRVDHVLIRVREVRTFCKFESKNDSSDSDYRICRDITWRECKWDDLSTNNLPNFVGSWRIEDENAGPTNQHRIQGLIRSLPLIDLPENLYQYSYVDMTC